MKDKAKTIIDLIRKSIKADMHLGRKENNPKNIHVSSLYDFCLKRVEIALKNNIGYSPPQSIDLGRAFTFKQGRYIQDLIVDSIVKEYPDTTIHRWRCLKCKKEVYSTKPAICKECNLPMNREEITLKYKVPGTDFTIIGNIDLFMGLDNKYYPIEIKGLRKEDFESPSPLFKYHYQLASYLWLLEKTKPLPQLSNEFGILLYVSKQHNRNPIKGFLVTKKNSDIIFKELDDIIKKLKTFSKTGKGGRICAHKASPIAKNCPFKEECWREK